MKTVCWIKEETREVRWEQPKCWEGDQIINDPTWIPLTFLKDAESYERALGQMRSGSSSVTIHSPIRFFDDDSKSKK